MSILIDPQVDDYMQNVTLNNFLQEGIIISISDVDEFLVPRPISISPGETFIHSRRPFLRLSCHIVYSTSYDTGSSAVITLKANRHTITYATPTFVNYECSRNTKFQILNSRICPFF